MESALRALRGTPLDGGEKIAIVSMLSLHVRSEAALTYDLTRGRERRGQDEVAMERDYGRNLAAVLDPRQFPELSAVVASGVFDVPEGRAEAGLEEEFTLAVILDGIELLIDRRAARDGD